jgi:hypothetical protein
LALGIADAMCTDELQRQITGERLTHRRDDKPSYA